MTTASQIPKPSRKKRGTGGSQSLLHRSTRLTCRIWIIERLLRLAAIASCAPGKSGHLSNMPSACLTTRSASGRLFCTRDITANTWGAVRTATNRARAGAQRETVAKTSYMQGLGYYRRHLLNRSKTRHGKLALGRKLNLGLNGIGRQITVVHACHYI